MIIIVKKQLQHIPRPPTLPPAVSLDKLHVPTVTLPGRSCGFDRLRMIMLDYVAYGGRPMLLEPDQLGPFSLLPPLKRGFIDWNISIFITAKMCSSFRVKPFETIQGEQIPTVFFFFRSNRTYFFFAGVHRSIFQTCTPAQSRSHQQIFWRKQNVSPRDLSISDLLKWVGVEEGSGFCMWRSKSCFGWSCTAFLLCPVGMHQWYFTLKSYLNGSYSRV